MPTNYLLPRIDLFICPRIARIFVQASAKPNLFELCRAQPKMSKKWTRRLCAKKNGDRVGRTNLHECNEFFIYMSCGVVPSRHIVLGSPIRALRTRLPSLRSVVPSRHSSSTKSFYPRISRIALVRLERPHRSPLKHSPIDIRVHS